MVRAKGIKNNIADVCIMGVLLVVTLLSLYPIWNTIAVSFSDKASAQGGLVHLIPKNFNLESYVKVLNDKKFFVAFSVSVKRVLLGGSIQFILTSMIAFALSRQVREFRFRNVYMWFMVFTMMFSGGMVPLYMTVNKIGIMDSIWALVLPGAVPVYSTILLMNFFRNVPKEMDQAAHIDGAGPWRLLMMIYLPISLPALATVTLFSLVGHWNSFFDGMIYMNKTANYPLATYIQTMVIPSNFTNMTADEIQRWAKVSDKTFNAAKIFICMIPILAVYPFLQRYFIHGIMLGSVKE